MKTIRIPKKYLAVIGQSSLEGLLVRTFGTFPEELRIEFEQTSMDWKRKHNGPDEIIIAEYVPECLCQSIAYLISQGIKIEIGSYSEDI